MATTHTVREGSTLRRIGVIGLAVLLVLNVVKWLMMGDPGASPLSGGWWLHWFAGYLVLTIVLMVGNAGRRHGPADGDERRSGGSDVGSETLTNQRIFDRVFKIYAEKRRTEREPQILEAIGDSVRSEEEAQEFLKLCQALEVNARHYVHTKVLGQISLATVRKCLTESHPDLSEESRQRAIELGAVLVAKE